MAWRTHMQTKFHLSCAARKIFPYHHLANVVTLVITWQMCINCSNTHLVYFIFHINSMYARNLQRLFEVKRNKCSTHTCPNQPDKPKWKSINIPCLSWLAFTLTPLTGSAFWEFHPELCFIPMSSQECPAEWSGWPGCPSAACHHRMSCWRCWVPGQHGFSSKDLNQHFSMLENAWHPEWSAEAFVFLDIE